MAFVRKMKEGDKSPTLYSMYGKLYDFDEMLRTADAGLNQYLSTLKRGHKNEAELRQAYSNIMNGIKNGTITFRDGHYVDSTGQYDNMSEGKIIKNKNKDYYGLMANYIYNTQNLLTAYTPPEDKSKIKWNGNTGVGSALSRHLYNSDSGNILDFIEADDIDPTTKKRGINGRTLKLYDSFKYVYDNFDNLFTGYTDSDKNLSLLYIKSAMDALYNHKIDAGDYLALSRAAGGLDYRSMLSDGSVSQSTTSEPLTVLTLNLSLSRANFATWMLEHYPQFTGTLSTPRSLVSPRRYGSGTINTLNSALSKLSNNDLLRMTRSLLADRNYTFNNELFIRQAFGDLNFGFDNLFGFNQILNAMRSKGMLLKIGDLTNEVYYIPGTDTAKLTAWVWDPSAHSVSEYSFHSIPQWLLRILKEYQAYTGNGDNPLWLALHPVYSQYLKEGGILKAGDGDKLVFSKNPEEYLYYFDWDDTSLDKWYLTIFLDENNLANLGEGIDASKGRLYRTESSTDNTSTGNGYYDFKIGGAKLETLPYYLRHLKWLGGDDDISKEYRKQYYSHYRKYQNISPKIYQLMFKNGEYDDTVGKEFALKLIGNYGKLANDQKNSVGHDVYKPILYTMRDRESDGYITNLPDNWLDLYEIDGDDKDDGDLFATIRYLKLKNPNKSEEPKTGDTPPDSSKPDTPEQETPGTGIKTVQLDPSKPGFDWSRILGAIPDLIDGYRVGLSIGTNNKIADVVRRSLNPALINPDERFSPVTGAYQEKQYRSKLGADGLDRYSRAFTSDASLQLAGQQDAKRQADNLAYQGFLADDKEIKRTANEALQRREWTHTNHIDVANKNALAINLTDRERAQLEATRRKLNWQSIDNYLKGISERQRTKFDAEEAETKNFLLLTRAADIEQKYLDAISGARRYALNWSRGDGYGKDLTEMPDYDNYSKLLEEAGKWKQALLFGAQASVLGRTYTNPYLNTDINTIVRKYHFRKGGKLIPKKYF